MRPTVVARPVAAASGPSSERRAANVAEDPGRGRARRRTMVAKELVVLVVYALVLLVGVFAMVVGSQHAVSSATALAATTRLPPFFIGLTLLAIGTDLPEIANSIVSSATGHGDVNIGDSVGSAATQATLILGLLPIIGGTFSIPRRGVAVTGIAATVSLVVLGLLVSDGHIGRVDSVVLLVLWGAGSWLVFGTTSTDQQLSFRHDGTPRRLLIIRTMVALALVGVAASIMLWAIVRIAAELSAPEFLVGFFLASIGTSLPELVFDITALRKGETAMAVGDVLGSSFVDATLSVGIGPLLFPTAVTVAEVEPAIWWAALTLAVVTLMMARIRDHDWRSGTILLAAYAAFFVVLL